MARELLSNVVKHAKVEEAKLSVKRADGWLIMKVEDHGVGFAAEELEKERSVEGFGLSSIQERLKLLGGELSITSSPGQGTCVVVSVQLNGGDESKGRHLV